MYYKFNYDTLVYEKVSLLPLVLRGGFVSLSIVLIGILFWGFTSSDPPITISTEDKLIIIKEHNEFSEEKLHNLIENLNFRFPDIIIAQSQLESNNYTSQIFKENNNLFGMKEAAIRSNLAKGTNRGHAYYEDWKESVLDYALYYSTYLYKLKTKEQYLEYLRQNYAEDPEYVNKLKKLITNN